MSYFKRILCLIAFALPLLIQAQSDDSSPKNEIGTDITQLVSQTLGAGYSLGQYQLTYKRHFNKLSLRLGAGFASTSQENLNQGEKYRNTYKSLNYRIGIEKPFPISNRWSGYYGIDFRHHYDSAHNEFYQIQSGWIVDRKEVNSNFGLAPLLGFQFSFSERLALRTELSILAQSTVRNLKFEATEMIDDPDGPTPSIDPQTFRGFKVDLTAPNFLVLAYRF